jgi:hypothetical protein
MLSCSHEVGYRIFLGEKMAGRIVINLEPEERSALGKLAGEELRDPREQVRFILRQELERRGLIDAKKAKASNPKVRGQNGS